MDQTSWQKAKDVLYEAQRLPGPEREAYVRLQFKDQPDVCEEVLAILPNADTPDDLSRPLVNLGGSGRRAGGSAAVDVPSSTTRSSAAWAAAGWDRSFSPWMRSCGAGSP